MTKKREYAVGLWNGIRLCGHGEYFICSPKYATREEAEEMLATLPSVPSEPEVIITRPPVKRGKGRCGCWEEV